MKTILIGLLMIFCVLSMYSQTFEVDGIAYSVTSAVEPFTVQVRPKTAPGYVGDIVVPYQVSYNDTIFTVTSIGQSAFRWNNSLTSLDFQCPIVFLSYTTFQESENLITVKFPSSLAIIEPCAFWGCTSLIEIIVHPDNENYTSVDGVFYSKNMTKLCKYPAARVDDDFEIPETVDTIREFAFNYCHVFDSLIIPDHVTVVGEMSFANTVNLEYLDLGDGIPYFGNNMIYNSADLKTIIIGDSFSSLDGYDFIDCPKLMIIEVSQDNNSFKAVDGVLFSKDGAVLVKYPNARGNYDIPFGVNSVGQAAFLDCKNLKSVEIPGTVTTIVRSAFNDCDSLTSLMIPNSVRYIYLGAFSSCELLNSVVIGNGLDSIGMSIFNGCDTLKSISFCSAIPPKFAGTSLGGAIDSIYVLNGSVSAYQQDSFWGQYVISGVEDCSVQNVELNSSVIFAIYPNPANTQITIQLEENSDAIFRIYDLTGKCLSSNTVQNNGSLSIDWLNTGMYLYTIEQNGKLVSGKLLKN